MSGMLVQANISPGGMPKLPVREVQVTQHGLAGDYQKNGKYHGGLKRAICLFSEEQYAFLRTQGIDLPAGSVGENFTTCGIDLAYLTIGDQLRVGPILIEITDVRTPCRSLDQWDKRLMRLITGNSGWVAKVLQGGTVKSGDAIEVLK